MGYALPAILPIFVDCAMKVEVGLAPRHSGCLIGGADQVHLDVQRSKVSPDPINGCTSYSPSFFSRDERVAHEVRNLLLLSSTSLLSNYPLQGKPESPDRHLVLALSVKGSKCLTGGRSKRGKEVLYG